MGQSVRVNAFECLARNIYYSATRWERNTSIESLFQAVYDVSLDDKMPKRSILLTNDSTLIISWSLVVTFNWVSCYDEDGLYAHDKMDIVLEPHKLLGCSILVRKTRQRLKASAGLNSFFKRRGREGLIWALRFPSPASLSGVSAAQTKSQSITKIPVVI